MRCWELEPCDTTDPGSQSENLHGDIDARVPPWPVPSGWSIAEAAWNPWSQCLKMGAESSCLMQSKPSSLIHVSSLPTTASICGKSRCYSEDWVMLYAAYSGILYMKELARSSVRWPGFNPKIEGKAGEWGMCQTCQGKWSRSQNHPYFFLRDHIWGRISWFWSASSQTAPEFDWLQLLRHKSQV